jgi:hypothetical protein
MTVADDPDDVRYEFDPEFAERLIGKYVLVGISVYDKRGEFKRQEQFHGTVVSAEAERGILLSLAGTRAGEQKFLPPVTNLFERAKPGTYSLRSTGEKVVDPDFTCTWRVNQPDA